MRLIYSSLRINPRSLPKHIPVMLGLLALPLTMKLEKAAHAKTAPQAKPSEPLAAPNPDPRVVRLKSFFGRLHCPVRDLADDFVHAADDNQLDWRLLPSISVVESGGGKAFRNNNLFGWDNGQYFFPTIRAGIHTVAFKLGKSPLYQHEDVVGKLRLYNPDQNYVTSVLDLMNRICPIENLKRVRDRVIRRQNEFVYAD
jgi:hypothetical protein